MKLYDQPVVMRDGIPQMANEQDREGYRKTLTYQILQAHNSGSEDELKIRFDSLTSHDITYVSIIESAMASGMKKFPLPYVMTNCHNSLCAVGGTINEDDHRFALSAARRFGGIFVPPFYGVIHSYNREMMAGCGRMILGSDSHTRYGALGTMGVGEGGGELVKQLLGKTYNIAYPRTVLIYLHGQPKKGVGPHDVALALVGATYASGFLKNSALEFAGPGISGLSQDFRNGIDVMTTETTCWSSIWETDARTREYFAVHKRPEAYRELKVEDGACYDAMVNIDLSEIESMIALPMHPSYAMPINQLLRNPYKYLREAQDRANEQLNGKVKIDLLSKIDRYGNIHVDQGVIAGCSGGIYENIMEAAAIIRTSPYGTVGFDLSVYPDSMPVSLELTKNGTAASLLENGVVYREAFCGPCFGAGAVPANNCLSIRHTTRNFPNREGSKPGEGQIASVALMDARSIAATAIRRGVLTAATDIAYESEKVPAGFDDYIYLLGVTDAWGRADKDYELVMGPNIRPWPDIDPLKKDLLIKIVSHIEDEVTTTDELIPSGETSSYRSNPLRLAEFTLSRRDPEYVPEAKKVAQVADEIKQGNTVSEIAVILDLLKANGIEADLADTGIGSAIYARKPGDGSAREQAASCQRVLGASANFAREYATKRYRSNCINWGILPFITDDEDLLLKNSWVYIRDIREHLDRMDDIEAFVLSQNKVSPIILKLGELDEEEKQILKDGDLINYYRNTRE